MGDLIQSTPLQEECLKLSEILETAEQNFPGYLMADFQEETLSIKAVVPAR
jgi:hypothetical protein